MYDEITVAEAIAEVQAFIQVQTDAPGRVKAQEAAATIYRAISRARAAMVDVVTEDTEHAR